MCFQPPLIGKLLSWCIGPLCAALFTSRSIQAGSLMASARRFFVPMICSSSSTQGAIFLMTVGEGPAEGVSLETILVIKKKRTLVFEIKLISFQNDSQVGNNSNSLRPCTPHTPVRPSPGPPVLHPELWGWAVLEGSLEWLSCEAARRRGTQLCVAAPCELRLSGCQQCWGWPPSLHRSREGPGRLPTQARKDLEVLRHAQADMVPACVARSVLP